MSIARSLLLRASRSQWLAEQFRRRAFAKRAVKRFMPGEDLQSALQAAEEFVREDIGTLFTNLGERIENRDEAAAVRDHYLQVLDAIVARKLPTHISVKPTHLGMAVDRDFCAASVIELARKAEKIGSFVWIDMEESYYVDDTLAVFRAARAQSDKVGLCMQTYLKRTSADLESLLPLAPAIRLVKGAYNEPPDVAFEKKSDTDRAFFELAKRMLDDGRGLPILGTHDLELIEKIRRVGSRFEVHMLYGIKAAEQRALAKSGVKVRVLISYGANWFPWYVRRLAERPANVWFVVKNMFS